MQDRSSLVQFFFFLDNRKRKRRRGFWRRLEKAWNGLENCFWQENLEGDSSTAKCLQFFNFIESLLSLKTTLLLQKIELSKGFKSTFLQEEKKNYRLWQTIFLLTQLSVKCFVGTIMHYLNVWMMCHCHVNFVMSSKKRLKT